MKNILAYYLIFLVHLITLTITINYNKLLKIPIYKEIPLTAINNYLTEYFNLPINNGSIDFNSFVNLIGFFLIGLNSRNKLIVIILSFVLIDGLIYYSEKRTNIFINLGFAVTGYIFGLYFNNRSENKLKEKNRDIIYDDYDQLI